MAISILEFATAAQQPILQLLIIDFFTVPGVEMWPSVRRRQEVGSPNDDAGKYLAEEIRHVMVELDVPIGLRALGYDENDIVKLVEGTLPQHRVTKLSPRPVGREGLEVLFRDALEG